MKKVDMSMGKRRKRERIENSNGIIFRFSMINYAFSLVGIVIKCFWIGKTAWDLLLLAGVVLAIFGQIIALDRLKCSSCYGCFTMILASILFTMANVVFDGSIVLIVLLPMILMCILYMNRKILNIMYGVWGANAAICLFQMLNQENTSIQSWRDFFLVLFICTLFGISAYMVNNSVTFQYAYVCSSLHEENKRNKKFYEDSIIDTTTDLLNRNAYNAYLMRYKSNTHSSICCIYIDVNGLHEYNNTYGHQAGDKMLKKVATVMKDCFQSDKQYRIGGDEFIVFMEDSNFESQMEELKKFQAQMKANRIYVACGMEWRDKNMDIHEMVKIADAKMYRDKERFYKTYSNGRNESRLYKKAVE